MKKRNIIYLPLLLEVLFTSNVEAKESYSTVIHIQNNTEKTLMIGAYNSEGQWIKTFPNTIAPNASALATLKSSDFRSRSLGYMGESYISINGSGFGYGCGISTQNYYTPPEHWYELAQMTWGARVKNGDTRINCYVTSANASTWLSTDVVDVNIIISAP